jgi:hypothetical protein
MANGLSLVALNLRVFSIGVWVLAGSLGLAGAGSAFLQAPSP